MFKTSVDSILADFGKKIVQLNALAAKQRENAEFHTLAIEAATELKQEALAEAARAELVAGKIKALVS